MRYQTPLCHFSYLYFEKRLIRESQHYSKQLIVLNILIWKKCVRKAKIF